MQRVRDPRLILLVSAAMLGAAIAFPLGAFASHTFTDVPTSNTFHADISALAASGVTTGCAAGKYCPKDFVTREQMAAFLNRLGALGPGKTPVVNADKVDGRDASDLTYVMDNENLGTVEINTVAWGPFAQLGFDAPSDGFVLVTGSVSLWNDSCSASCWVQGAIELGTTAAGDTVAQQMVDVPLFDTMTMTRVVPVEAGSNTMELRLKRAGGTSGIVRLYLGQISAIFSPFGETHS